MLLSVLFLPWVIEELEREEAGREPRMKIGEVILFIRDLIQPICTRMSLAAGTRHQIEQALETLWRLLEPPTDRRAQFRFVYREPFNDALALLELYALSSGKYVDVFRQWQQFAQRVGAPRMATAPKRANDGEEDGASEPPEASEPKADARTRMTCFGSPACPLQVGLDHPPRRGFACAPAAR